MTGPLFIVGCGGFGREVFLLVNALTAVGQAWPVVEFVDDAPSAANLALVHALGSVHVGTVADLARRSEPFSAVIAIGDPTARASIAATLADAPVTYPTLVHPSSTVGSDARLEAGVVIAAGARLSTNIIVRCHTHIDQNATVGHDCDIGSYSRLNPQACVSGSVVLGDQVVVGAGATILQGLVVGGGAVVGAAACVVRDVSPGVVVKGVPAQ